jgi:hypothetical protein
MRKLKSIFRVDAWEPDGTFIGAWMRLPNGKWMQIIAEVSIEIAGGGDA